MKAYAELLSMARLFQCYLSRVIVISFCVSFVLAPDLSFAAELPKSFNSALIQSTPKSPSQLLAKRKNIRKRRPKSFKKSKTPIEKPKETHFAYGLDLGWEARYGNALTFHLLKDNLHFNAGFGINLSGPKFGVGIDYAVHFAKRFGIRPGAAIVNSLGWEDEVELDAKFTPQGSSRSQDIVAKKEYTVSQAQLLNLGVGIFYKLKEANYILLNFGYNVVLNGNQVTLAEELEYDKNIEVINNQEFDEEFNNRAKKEVEPGGVGASLGLIIGF